MGRYRIEFGKESGARFLSHLELMKAFERALRRAGLPMAFSEGFNPRPKMSFASAVAVGVTSAREYLDLELREELEADQVLEKLRNTLPPGLSVVSCRKIPPKAPALMAEIEAAEYEARLKLTDKLTKAEIDDAIAKLLERDSIVVVKEGKKGPENKELKEGIYELRCTAVEEGWAHLLMRVKSGSRGNIRPEEVLKALQELALLSFEPELAVIHRTGLFVNRKGQLVSPMQ